MRFRSLARVLATPLALLSLGAAATVRPAGAAPAPAENRTTLQEAKFDILRGDQLLGTESFRIDLSGDTLIAASTVRLDGAGPESTLPLEKRLTYLRRRMDSYPLVFRVGETSRDTSLAGNDLNCVFRDTVATIYRERAGRGRAEAVALPPGRLYLFEPGVYLPVQLLLADFVAGSQQKRRQPVLIPSSATVVDLVLTRTGRDTITAGGRRIPTTRVEMTDNLTPFTAWLDDEGRMWRLEATGKDLIVERRGDAVTGNRATKEPR